ncbi:hypothetical protein NPIL_684361 [Nephila pilipes]|uniref:Uncharacterized protein n=1 Tax=Nephila pilipes TaxID=299642 RepID=A0A8X6TL68_NEPPI|nr:hypothetical protein NPIL_684361 [Nephila pilipes]
MLYRFEKGWKTEQFILKTFGGKTISELSPRFKSGDFSMENKPGRECLKTAKVYHSLFQFQSLQNDCSLGTERNSIPIYLDRLPQPPARTLPLTTHSSTPSLLGPRRSPPSKRHFQATRLQEKIRTSEVYIHASSSP